MAEYTRQDRPAILLHAKLTDCQIVETRTYTRKFITCSGPHSTAAFKLQAVDLIPSQTDSYDGQWATPAPRDAFGNSNSSIILDPGIKFDARKSRGTLWSIDCAGRLITNLGPDPYYAITAYYPGFDVVWSE